MKPSLLFLLAAWLIAPLVQAQTSFRVLVFSKTNGYRHEAIETGVATVKQLGAQYNFDVDTTEDSLQFNDNTLKQYDVVVFLNTTQNVLGEAEQAAFEKYIQSGKGYVGIHAAADTEYDWPWYGQLVGHYFDSHPKQQTAMLHVEDAKHPASAHLPDPWEWTDEWYNYKEDQAGDLTVLLTVDESSYEGGNMGAMHPMAWYHEFDGGRAFYTGLGHRDDCYEKPEFLQHLYGALYWAATGKKKLPNMVSTEK
ncbi:cytochrome c/hypothetical protein [Catalinimonas alkaloidigena]|uniref:ThuA-like domain-containing protein n=1 Tax=Catalinimonas alkaloidigena TaxID=1075417 RepID=A0A1G9R522_9BACT|nr:ThuA domain-containing protein [Catalinimonas alkaloidigena]SDM18379.1 cytochrome c/hypothetical protein [Catalinimonas alkaloidigena]